MSWLGFAGPSDTSFPCPRSFLCGGIYLKSVEISKNRRKLVENQQHWGTKQCQQALALLPALPCSWLTSSNAAPIKPCPPPQSQNEPFCVSLAGLPPQFISGTTMWLSLWLTQLPPCMGPLTAGRVFALCMHGSIPSILYGPLSRARSKT